MENPRSSLEDLDLIGQLFPSLSEDSSPDFISFPQPVSTPAQPVGPTGFPHSVSCASFDLPGQSPKPSRDHGQDADQADTTKTAQAGITVIELNDALGAARVHAIMA